MKTYTAPRLTELGTVANLTADSGENNTQDTAYTLIGRLAGRGGSFDSCAFHDNYCLPETGAGE